MRKIHTITEKPPYGNTGVENTSHKSLRPLVDWVSCTFFTAKTWVEIAEEIALDFSLFKPIDGHMKGYKEHMNYGHITFHFNGMKEGMGIHLEMSGQGCREYEMILNNNIQIWNELFTYVLVNGHFTRLDVAVDDFQGYFSIPTLIRKVKNGECVSKFQKGRNIETIRLESGEVEGNTLYLGSTKSEIQIRFYDKIQERISKGIELEDGLNVWIRTEIQCTNKRADIMAAHVISSKTGQAILGVLKHYVRFVDKNKKDLNRSRWEDTRWWKSFLKGISVLTLTTAAPDRTIEKTKNWIEKSVSKSLGMIFYALDSDFDYMVELLNDGMEKMGKKEFMLIDLYKKKLSQMNDSNNGKI